MTRCPRYGSAKEIGQQAAERPPGLIECKQCPALSITTTMILRESTQLAVVA